MLNFMKYDSVDWLIDDFDETAVTLEQAYTQIGCYFAWLIERNLVTDSFVAEHIELIKDLQSRIITPDVLLDKCCDGELRTRDLKIEGNAFRQSYYEAGLYEADFKKVFQDEQLNFAPFSWELYNKLSEQIDLRYKG